MNSPASANAMISGPAHGREVQHDRGADRVDQEDRDPELALGHPARQDRVRRVERPDVVVGVDAARRVEVVVDHVVRGVRQHEPDDGDGEEAPIDRRPAGDAIRLDREQPTDQPGPDGHREDGGPRDDQPLADRVERSSLRRIRRLEDLLPGEQSLAQRRSESKRRRGRESGVAAVLIWSSIGLETCDENVSRSRYRPAASSWAP